MTNSSIIHLQERSARQFKHCGFLFNFGIKWRLIVWPFFNGSRLWETCVPHYTEKQVLAVGIQVI